MLLRTAVTIDAIAAEQTDHNGAGNANSCRSSYNLVTHSHRAIDATPAVSSKSPPLRWHKKLLFGCLTTVAFFLLLECALAILGVPRGGEEGDPLVGFSSYAPLFEPTRQGSQRTALGKLVWFNDQSFPISKPAGTKRIFCVGGSTTFGRPFADSTSYCGWLREYLSLVDPDTKWEVINAGGVSYASYRVASLMEELAQYDPDLFIVYSVHNEFLERRTYANLFETSQIQRDLQAALQRSRIWSLANRLVQSNEAPKEMLPSEVDEMLNHSIGPQQYHRDAPWQDGVLQHYKLNLRRMIQIASDANAKIAFVTPASNLRDCSPFKSEFSAKVSDSEIAIAEQQLSDAKDAIDQQDFETARVLSEKVLALDKRHSLANYLHGKALFGQGQHEEAESAFTKARDEDICPLRATGQIESAIQEVADDPRCLLIDFHDRLQRLSLDQYEHTCFGGEYFLDHVHPTIQVHRDLAVWILDELQKADWVAGELPTTSMIAQVEQRIDAGLDLTAHCVAFRNLAKVLHWSGKFDEAIPRAQDALDLIPEDLESRFVLADSLNNVGREQEALEEYVVLFQLGDFPRAYMPYGELLLRKGDYRQAKSFLSMATLADPTLARAFYLLGISAIELGDYSTAIEALERSNEMYPNDPSTLGYLELARTAAAE